MRIFLTETWGLRISFFCSAPPRRVCCLFPPGWPQILSAWAGVSQPCPCVLHAPALYLCGDHLLHVGKTKPITRDVVSAVVNKEEEWLPSTCWAHSRQGSQHGLGLLCLRGTAGLCSASCPLGVMVQWLVSANHSLPQLPILIFEKEGKHNGSHTSQNVGVFCNNLLKWTKCKP